MKIYTVIHENLDKRGAMDESVVATVDTFTTKEKAVEFIRTLIKKDEMGLIPSEDFPDTWFDPDQGTELISIVETYLQ